MAFPVFLRSKDSILFEVRKSPQGPVAGRAATAANLSFIIQKQLQDNWCWSAVSTSVSRFYDSKSPWTQCLVANAALPRKDCCTAGPAADPDKCNQPWYLDTALEVVGHFRAFIEKSLSFSDVQTEIAQGNPLGCRFAWRNGSGSAHFMLIVGWVVAPNGRAYIDIADPIYLYTQVALDEFESGYQGGGDWTHSYRIQNGSVVGPIASVSPSAPVDAGAIGA